MNSRELGNLGEKIACQYLGKKGYRILNTNFKRKWGEIDVVAKKQGKIIFVEVKTLRRTEQTEDKVFIPENEIDWKKKKQLRKMAQIYLTENRISLNSRHQIDIMAIEIYSNPRKVRLRHYQNAIEDIY